MVISYYGHECFRVQFGQTVVAINPPRKDSSFKTARFGADIALLSSATDPDVSGASEVAFGGKEPFVIAGPGAYEIGGVVVNGFFAGEHGGRRYTLYTLLLEGMTLATLSGIAGKTLPPDIAEHFGATDILFVPVSAPMNPSDAYALAVSLEPQVIIPMRWSGAAGESALKTFLKEGGEEKAARHEKLTLKRKDLEGKEGNIMVLAPTGG